MLNHTIKIVEKKNIFEKKVVFSNFFSSSTSTKYNTLLNYNDNNLNINNNTSHRIRTKWTNENQKNYFKELEKTLKITSIEDWYNIPSKNIGNLYQKYNSMYKMLQNIYPNHIWLPWKFSYIPKGCFNSTQGKIYRRCWLENSCIKLSIISQDQWYDYSLIHLIKTGNSFFFQSYSSLVRLLSNIFPEINWIAPKFSQVPAGYWNSLENQRSYFKHLENALNIKKIEDWYQIPALSIVSTVYKKYNSMIYMLQNIYPQHIWLIWEFLQTGRGCWKGNIGKYNRRQYLDKIAKSELISENTNWYSLSVKDIYKKGHTSFLDESYKGNLFYCLLDLYPEINWIPWKFSRVSANFWDSDKNISEFLNWCMIFHFKMKSKKDWYFITTEQMDTIGAYSLLLKYNGLYNLLIKYYSNENWDLKKFKFLKIGGKTQFELFKKIKILFNDKILYQNYKHPNLFFKNTNKKIELDIFLPSLNLAFEYQGQHHYEKSNIFGTEEPQKKRDLEKQELCKNNSITLIQIPFNWDKNISSLKKIINSTRPDILI